MTRINKDAITGILFTIFSLVLFFVIIPLQVEPSEGGPMALSPRLFCQIVAVMLLLLSTALTYNGFFKSTEEAAETGKKSPFRSIITIVVASVYVLIMVPLGYFFSTALTMIFFLWFFGLRDWRGGFYFLLIILPFIYLLFVIALKVILPSGIAF